MASKENESWEIASEEAGNTLDEIAEREWLVNALRTAQSIARLQFLTQGIAKDYATGKAYTQDTEHMDELRKVYLSRFTQLTENGGNDVNGIIREGHIPADAGDGTERQDAGGNS